MEGQDIHSQVKTASKWSLGAEVIAKLITPLTNMALARLLTPEAFGVVATIMMVITFVEIFTDAGFQRYIVQHAFRDEQELEQNTTVAFWCTLTLAVVLWGVIIAFNAPIARLVGNPGLGYVIAIACVCIPMAAISGIPMALFRRALDFKTQFKLRMIGVAIPVVVTIPLAIWLHSYWALVIGIIAQHAANMILLLWASEWKPRWYFSWTQLKEMFGFSAWSMFESLSIWLTNYLDIFIVGSVLSAYYLGLYKTSITTVIQLFGVITLATQPVLFAALSRLQDDKKAFEEMFFRVQKWVALFVFPLGAGIYLFRDLVTQILLGDQWMEASGFIGRLGLTFAITVVLSFSACEIYRAQGRFQLSVLVQWIQTIFLIPALWITAHYDFETLYITYSWVRLVIVVAQLVVLRWVIHLSMRQMFTNIIPSVVSAVGMALVGWGLTGLGDTLIWQLVCVVLCILVYGGLICLFPQERAMLRQIVHRIPKRK